MELIQAVELALVIMTVVTNILCKAPHHLELQEKDYATCSVYYVPELCLLLVVFCVPKCESLIIRVEMENSMA